MASRLPCLQLSETQALAFLLLLPLRLQATYLGYAVKLPDIDTYFMLDCSGAKDLAAVDTDQLPGAATAAFLQPQPTHQSELHAQQRWLDQQHQRKQQPQREVQLGTAGQSLDVVH